MKYADHFFETARERYAIMLRRLEGAEKPWTDDPVFRAWRFCNVHREDDKTTKWFNDYVRSKVKGLRAVEACLIFRWFNRIETGERIISHLLHGWNHDSAYYSLKDVKPLVTGAYMIKTVSGMNKLDGILWSIDDALPKLPSMIRAWGHSLREATEDLSTLNHIGPFMAYEIVSDLRHTDVLNKAGDINRWANAGPGCAHGLGLVIDGQRYKFNRNSAHDQALMNICMHQLLMMSRNPDYWPKQYAPWEMREVEHWACEYDKYCRANSGEQLKRRFQHEMPGLSS